MRGRLAHGLALALLVAGLGAAQGPNNSEATPAPDNTAQVKPEVSKPASKPKPYQIGTASWYGEYFDGKPTASGEEYDKYDMTAAHPPLP
jgi:rare lipoprotein A